MSIFTKLKGIARIFDPSSAPTHGEIIDPSFDANGRLVTYPYALRGAVGTVSTTMQNNSTHAAQANNETVLTDVDSSYFNDIIYVYGVNGSDQAIRLVFRENYNGADLFRLQMPASSSAEINFKVPWRQSEKAMTWRADYEVYGGVTDANDVTNTTVRVALQYIKNL